MSKPSAPAEPKVMPTLPAASIDFNALLDADARGATGDALVAAAAVLVPRELAPGETLAEGELPAGATAKPIPAPTKA